MTTPTWRDFTIQLDAAPLACPDPDCTWAVRITALGTQRAELRDLRRAAKEHLAEHRSRIIAPMRLDDLEREAAESRPTTEER